VTRFFFGMWMAIGALVFLGCPFRMLQRIGGGDMNAVIGAAGFLGASASATSSSGAATPSAARRWSRRRRPRRPRGRRDRPPPLRRPHAQGPAAGLDRRPAHAGWLAALAIAGFAGVALSATGFCAVSAARQVFLKRKRMLLAALLLVAGYAAVALATGGFRGASGASRSPHRDVAWNLLAMVSSGSPASSPEAAVRQMVMAGEGTATPS